MKIVRIVENVACGNPISTIHATYIIKKATEEYRKYVHERAFSPSGFATPLAEKLYPASSRLAPSPPPQLSFVASRCCTL
jgi:hypothetical protein